MFLPVTTSASNFVSEPRASITIYQFGTVSLLDEPYADHDFVYANTGSVPVVIERLQPSCHCTSALIDAAGGAGGTALPYTVAPGGTVTIHASINLGEDPAGPISRTVSLFTQGRTKPAAIFMLRGTVEPDIQFSPAALDFGTIPAGKAASAAVLVTVDGRLIPNGFPKVISDDPKVVVVSLPNPYHGPGLFKADRAGAESDQWFEVTVPAGAALGPVAAHLSLAGGPSSLPAAIAQFEGNTGEVDGTVKGAVEAVPETVSFGTLLKGQSAARTVELIGKSQGDLIGLRVIPNSPYLTAVLSPAARGRKSARTLTIRAGRTTPTGDFRSRITVLLADGQRLDVPVTGYLTIPAE